MSQDNLLTTAQAAKFLGVSVKSVKNWRKSGKLIPDKTGENGYFWYSADKLGNFKSKLGKKAGTQKNNGADLPTQKAGKLTQTGDTQTGENDSKTREHPQKKEQRTMKKQFRENFPAEIATQSRFFAVNADKVPKIAGWSKPENQKPLAVFSASEIVGFDICGHGNADDYCLLDVDDGLNDDNSFVNDKARDICKKIRAVGTYGEKSISGKGLHFLLKPSADFQKITNTEKNIIFFDYDNNHKSKLEIFYKGDGRYCLLTGDKLSNCDTIVSGKAADDLLHELFSIANAEYNFRHPHDNETHSKKKKSANSLHNQPTEQERAAAMLEFIPCSEITRDQWREIGMALKNNGNSLAEWENWSASDTARYKVGECARLWQGFNGNGLTIATIHDIAKDFGYSEKEFRAEWYKKHPEAKQKIWEDFERDNSSTDESQLDDADITFLYYLPHTDLYNATRIAGFYGKEIRFLHDSGKWFTFDKDKGIWLDGGKENSAISHYCRKMAFTIIDNKDRAEDTEAAEKLAKKWQRASTIANAITLLKSVDSIRITEQDLNTHKNLLNCLNCVIDLQTGKEYPHDSKYLLTQCVNAVYSEPDLKAIELVSDFFTAILPDEDFRQFLKDYLGYCLTGEISLQKALFIIGTGGNGKSTLTRLLNVFFGNYFVNFPIEAVLEQPFKRADGNTATPTSLAERRATGSCRGNPQKSQS